ncbi:glycerol acyltransferase [Nostoc sp. 'Peltigera membranacea cyanobiont' 210A]|uniref:lysophospholipid acyltransferase family protein n=1 Tax=Nostoc sp. 'Peltigera membranacea cyanobiont' 210A TaxID=2014529 RepID=UPI000B9553CD|nr:lysophospholipid acyltransferase family protein [Nostoc sp. 'Peltigera membranacea cyanobiont' 210A]OYD97863.1 glycerol acyltransferase [Nostoc sp. 'Peltigera membranacea cyanobiont' 210A]
MLKKQHLLNKKLGWSLDERDPKFIESLMPLFGFLYHYYFRVQTSGWDNIPPQQKVLLVGSHNGGLAAPDMSMMMYDWFQRFGVEKPIYGLMHPKAWQVSPPLAQMAAKAGAIIAHPKMAYTALRSGASVLVYPGGAEDVFRPHYLRNKIYLAGRQGFIKLALRENVPIVPMISWGAHDTLIVIADCYKVVQQLHEWGMPWLLGIDPEVFPIYLGLPWGLAIGPLPNIPLPVPIYTRVCPPIVFERYGREAASDRYYVNECYELVVSQMQQELDNLIKLTAQTNSL